MARGIPGPVWLAGSRAVAVAVGGAHRCDPPLITYRLCSLGAGTALGRCFLRDRPLNYIGGQDIATLGRECYTKPTARCKDAGQWACVRLHVRFTAPGRIGTCARLRRPLLYTALSWPKTLDQVPLGCVWARKAVLAGRQCWCGTNTALMSRARPR